MDHDMYHDFSNEIKLVQYIDVIISKLSNPETMKAERNKLCRTCKGKYFIISHGCYSRGEGVMGTIKGNRKLKDQIKSRIYISW